MVVVVVRTMSYSGGTIETLLVVGNEGGTRRVVVI